MGKVILFIRVSTISQKMESQELVARRMAHTDGYTDDDILEPIKYKESAVKLSKQDRQGLQDLYRVLETRDDIDAIYVTELSRLSRQPQVLYSIRDFLVEKKVQLVCGSPSFKLLDNNKKLDKHAQIIFAIFGCFAEQEITEKKERFARGKEQKALENKYNGGNIPFGYKVDKTRDNLIVVDPVDSEIVRDVFNLYESGVSQTALARHFNQLGNSKLTISFINNILNNERYTGRPHCYEGSSYTRQYPIIITPEQYDRCRDIANKNNSRLGKAKNVYFASHLIVCSQCGCYFSASGSKVCYHCYNAFSANRKYNNPSTPQCKNKISISINVVDSLLWKLGQEAELEYIINNADDKKIKLQHQIDELRSKISAIDTRLESIEERRRRIVKSYINGNLDDDEQEKMIDEVNSAKNSVLLEQIDFQNKLYHLQSLVTGLDNIYGFGDVSDIANNIGKIIQIKNRIADITDDQQRSDIIHRHINKITVDKKQIEYQFKLVGKKKTNARFLTIHYYNDVIKYFYVLTNSGTVHPVILLADSKGRVIEKISYEYLNRFIDKGKRVRRERERNEKMAKDEKAYPSDSYVRSYSGLAKYLGFNSLHNAYRWVENGVLKPAIVGKYNGEIIFDKSKCIELLSTIAMSRTRRASWAKKIIEKINNNN